jgi:hypothetical protein
MLSGAAFLLLFRALNNVIQKSDQYAEQNKKTGV